MPRTARFGSIYKKTRRDGTPAADWSVRYVEAGRRIERSGFASIDSAETFLAARRVDRSEMRALGLAEPQRVPVRQVVEEYREWLASHRRPNTVRGSAATLNFLVERHGARDMVTLSTEDVAAALESMRRDRGHLPGSAAHALAVLSGLWRWAVTKRFARAIDAKILRRRLPKGDVEEPPYLSPDELRAVYAAVPPALLPVVVLWGEAGLRMAEAAYLTWGELRPDLLAVTIGGTRSKGHRARTVHLTEHARSVLAAALAGRVRSTVGSEPIWPELRGHRAGDAFRVAMLKIGRPDITPKTLRHAFGSGAAMAGVDLEILRRLMGHRSISTTMVYACHRPKSAERDAIEMLQRHRAPPVTEAKSG